MAFDLRRVSREFKEKLQNLKNLSLEARADFACQRRAEFGNQSLARAYGFEKLRRQKWIVPDHEFETPVWSRFTAKDAKDAMQIVRNAENFQNIQSEEPGVIDGSRVTSAGQAPSPQQPNVGVVGDPDPHARQDKSAEDEASFEGSVRGGTGKSEGGGGSSTAGGSGNQEKGQIMNGNDEQVEVEPTSGIPVEHLALLPRDEALRLINERRAQRAKQLSSGTVANGNAAAGGGTGSTASRQEPHKSQWELGREEGMRLAREQARYEIEKELRAQLGLPAAWSQQPKMIEWHRQQLNKLAKADAAPRCTRTFTDGTKCRAPKLKDGMYCYAHEHMVQMERRYKKLRLMAQEDAGSIMFNLGEIGQAMVNGEISGKLAGQLLWREMLGMMNLKMLGFRSAKHEEMVTEMADRSGDRVIRGSGDRRGKTHRRDKRAEDAAVVEGLVRHGGDGIARNAQNCQTIQIENREELNARSEIVDGSRVTSAEQVPHARQNKRAEDAGVLEGSVRNGGDGIARNAQNCQTIQIENRQELNARSEIVDGSRVTSAEQVPPEEAISSQHSAFSQTTSVPEPRVSENNERTQLQDGSRVTAAEQVPHARQDKSAEDAGIAEGSVRNDTRRDKSGHDDGSRATVAEPIPHARQGKSAEDAGVLKGSVRNDNAGVDLAKSFKFGVDGVDGRGVHPLGVETGKLVNG